MLEQHDEWAVSRRCMSIESLAILGDVPRHCGREGTQNGSPQLATCLNRCLALGCAPRGPVRP
ncbi:MAG TPA: hypothetical protein VE684_21555, partial [Crenalkalicoccus sp.]|nr:hypothetical protein [Crenalkalicoccus sp.]